MTLLTSARSQPEDESPVAGMTERRPRAQPPSRVTVIADPAMIELYERARRLARSEVPVAIHGESGTGKELVARALHEQSARAGAPFIAINCAAIPEGLAEAELFGHARGAFTGAAAARAGVFESASGGTLFLDEVAELSAAMQARLLRVLECGEVRRLGETAARCVDVRVVCASLADLRVQVAAGRFREDLYYRLGTARLELPPLRARPRDLAVLAREFVVAACQRAGRAPLCLSPEVERVLAARRWPGNVRELRHAIDHAVALAPDDAADLDPRHLPAEMAARADDPAGRPFRPIADELQALERQRMIEALHVAGGVQIRAAALLSMPMRSFATKMRRYAIAADAWRG